MAEDKQNQKSNKRYIHFDDWNETQNKRIKIDDKNQSKSIGNKNNKSSSLLEHSETQTKEELGVSKSSISKRYSNVEEMSETQNKRKYEEINNDYDSSKKKKVTHKNVVNSENKSNLDNKDKYGNTLEATSSISKTKAESLEDQYKISKTDDKSRNTEPTSTMDTDGSSHSVLVEIDEDLFNLSKDIPLAHCVAEDLLMSAGIAVQFKSYFGGVENLIQQKLVVGNVGQVERHNKIAFYLITKKKSNGKPTMETLENALKSLVKKMKELKLTKLGIPKIGCGLDRLNWCRVKELILNVFQGSGIHITVCIPSRILDRKPARLANYNSSARMNYNNLNRGYSNFNRSTYQSTYYQNRKKY